MSEPEARKPASQGVTRERDKDDVLIDGLTEDEDRLFLAAVLEA